MSINRPRVGVSVLVRQAGRVLLVKRRREPFAGFWSFPGGHVEGGETLAEAAAREVREETGIAVGDLRQIDFAEIIRRDPGGGIVDHIVLVVFGGAPRSGVLNAGDDAREARWVVPSEFADLQITEDTRRVIASHADEGWDTDA